MLQGTLVLICVVAVAGNELVLPSSEIPKSDSGEQQLNQIQLHKHSLQLDTDLASHPACLEDVKRLCKGVKQEKTGAKHEIRNNFEVLNYLMSYDAKPPSAACQMVSFW